MLKQKAAQATAATSTGAGGVPGFTASKKPDHSHPTCHHSKSKGNMYDGLYEY